MTEHTKIEALHRQLVEERRRVVEIAAESGALPPANLLAYLANLDGATLAVEAVIEEQPPYERRSSSTAISSSIVLRPGLSQD